MFVICPHCNRELSAPDQRAGTLVTCPSCRGSMELPYLDQVEPPVEIPAASRPVRRTPPGLRRPSRPTQLRKPLDPRAPARGGAPASGGRPPQYQNYVTGQKTNPVVFVVLGLIVAAVPILYFVMGKEKDKFLGTWTIDANASVDGIMKLLWEKKETSGQDQITRNTMLKILKNMNMEMTIDYNYATMNFPIPQQNYLKGSVRFVRENLGANRYKLTGTKPDGNVMVLYAWMENDTLYCSGDLGEGSMIFRRK